MKEGGGGAGGGKESGDNHRLGRGHVYGTGTCIRGTTTRDLWAKEEVFGTNEHRRPSTPDPGFSQPKGPYTETRVHSLWTRYHTGPLRFSPV